MLQNTPARSTHGAQCGEIRSRSTLLAFGLQDEEPPRHSDNGTAGLGKPHMRVISRTHLTTPQPAAKTQQDFSQALLQQVAAPRC